MVIGIKGIDLMAVSVSDAFIVDANVLLYIHRPQTNMDTILKAGEYSRFIGNLRSKGCRIIVSSLHLQEALNAIEGTSWRRYRDSDSSKKRIGRKDFRGIAGEREGVKREQLVFLSQINEIYEIMEDDVRKDDLNAYTDTLETHSYDPLDYIVANRYSVIGIITDDSDFTYDANINVYRYLVAT